MHHQTAFSARNSASNLSAQCKHVNHFTTLSVVALVLASCSDRYDSGEPGADALGKTNVAPGAGPVAPPIPPDAPTLERVMDQRPPVAAQTPPPPISGGSLRVLANGSTAVAADPARDVVHFVDLDAGSVVRTVQLAAGARPGRIAESPGLVHVALAGAGGVISLDAQGNTVWRVDTCAEPRGIDYLAHTDQLLLACRDGQLFTLSPASGQASLLASLPTDLRDVLVVPSAEDPSSGDANIYVSRFRSAELLRVNTDGSVAQTTTLPDVNMLRSQPIEPPQSDPGAGDVTLPSPSTLVETAFAPTVAWRARVVDGEVVMLHQRAQRGEVHLSSEGGYGGGACEGVVQPAVSKLGQETAVLSSSALSFVNVGVDFAISPDGNWFAIADAGVPDPGVPREFNFVGEESFPGPVAVTGGVDVAPTDTSNSSAFLEVSAPVQLFSAEGLNMPDPGVQLEGSCGPTPFTSLTAAAGTQATAVDFNPTRPAQLVALTRQPSTLIIVDDVTEATAPRTVPLGGADISDTGHDLFHRVDTAVACVHCHPGGADDGHVWNFEGFGARRTQTLETGLRPPFHWDGELTDMSQLMKEVFQGRMSAAPQSPARVAALSDWLSSLTPPAPGKIAKPDLVEQGRQLFESPEVGCAACHSGAALSDGALHDVGTGDVPLKTPSLLGVSQRLPVMHDGCATSLQDRFFVSCGGDDRHGATSNLSATQRDALAAYLTSL